MSLSGKCDQSKGMWPWSLSRWSWRRIITLACTVSSLIVFCCVHVHLSQTSLSRAQLDVIFPWIVAALAAASMTSLPSRPVMDSRGKQTSLSYVGGKLGRESQKLDGLLHTHRDSARHLRNLCKGGNTSEVSATWKEGLHKWHIVQPYGCCWNYVKNMRKSGLHKLRYNLLNLEQIIHPYRQPCTWDRWREVPQNTSES
jgi:hypothetical protein